MKNLRFLAAGVRGDSIAVDIGTFEGRHLQLLREIVGPRGRVIGTDIHSDRFADISKQGIAELIAASLDATLPKAIDCEGMADIGICHRVLHHLADERAVALALAGVAGLLRSGGRILLSIRELGDRRKSERSDTPNPDGTRRTDLYFGRDAFARLVEPFFEIVLEESIGESEFYTRDEPVEVVIQYLAMALRRR